ncbi:MAG: hypothetical protein IJX27_06750 [Clostridia bacterium]|nr:hypothetical protein [Clostridia bacterium]
MGKKKRNTNKKQATPHAAAYSGDTVKSKKTREILFFALGLLFAAAAFGTVIYYIAGPAQGYFHSDCADSLYWAEAAAESGKVFNPDFFYAALLPFSAQVWLVPLIHIFGVTMAAHTAGMVIFALLFFASVIFFCRSMEWSYSFSFFTAGLVLLLLSSSDKMREIMWGHVIYYSLGLIILFTGMGLMLRTCRHLEKGNRKKGFIYAAVFLVFMTFAATNGTQCVAIYTLPMFASLAAYVVFNNREKLVSAKNGYYLLAALILCISTALGGYILDIWKGDIIAGYADAYSLFYSVDGWVDNLLKFPECYFSLCGVNMADGTALNGEGTLKEFIRLGVSVVILALPLVLLFCYKKIEDAPTKLLLWVHVAVSAVIMVGFICGRLSAGNWRLLPMVGTGIIASAAAIRFMLRMSEGGFSWRRVGALFMLVTSLCAIINLKEISDMPRNYGRGNAQHGLAAFLREEGLEYGFAEFWTAQATTVIADSDVKVRPIVISRESGISPYHYQSNVNWFSDQTGLEKYFVALSESDYTTVSKSDEWAWLTSNHYVKKLKCDSYLVFVFDANPITAISQMNAGE